VPQNDANFGIGALDRPLARAMTRDESLRNPTVKWRARQEQAPASGTLSNS